MLIFIACQPTPISIPTPTVILTSNPTSTTIPTPTLNTSPQISLAIPLSTAHFYPQTYQRADFSISFSEVRDLGQKVGGKLNFTEQISIKPEFQSSYHLIGIFISVEPPRNRHLVMRTGQLVIQGNTSQITPLDYILTPQGMRIDSLGFCNRDLDVCNGLGMPFARFQLTFDQPSWAVRVFAVPNSLRDFTYYSFWDDPHYLQ